MTNCKIAAKSSASRRSNAIEDIVDGQAFLLSDLNRNWWEIAYLRN